MAMQPYPNPFELQPMDARTENETLHYIFNTSPTLGLCRDTLCGAILTGDVFWFDKTLKQKKRSTQHYFEGFIRNIITQLFVYGYATYCLMKRKKVPADSDIPIEKHFYPFVADGREYRIELNEETWNWELLTDSKYAPYKKGGMELLIDNEPIRETSSRYMVDSCVSRSAPSIMQINELDNNIFMRDMYNSKPSVYTTITPRVTANEGRQTQWFTDQNIQNIPDKATPGHPLIDTFNDNVESRSNFFGGVHITTQMNRAYNKKGIDIADIPYRIQNPVDGAQPLNLLDHREYFITDGHIPDKMPTLKPGDDVVVLKTAITHRIMQICGVPPQATGEEYTGNSERKPSANMIQEQSLQQYRRKVCKYQCYINTILKNISTILDPSGKEVLQLDIPIPPHNLLAMEGILEEDAVIDYMHCIHGIAPHKIDKEALKQRKETINLEQAMERRATSNGSILKRTKPPKTDLDKAALENPRKEQKKNGVKKNDKHFKRKRIKPKQSDMQKTETSRAQAGSYK